MSLIIEDGTGKATADSYVSIADFRAWAAARGRTEVEDLDDEDIEPKLREATEYIDTNFLFKGQRASVSQQREFPRAGLFDAGGLTVSGVPWRVRDACATLAHVALSEPLYVSMDRGGRVVSRSVGPISQTYAEDAPAGKVFYAAANLLAQYVRGEFKRLRLPGSAGVPAATDAGYFALGAMTNPSLPDPFGV